MLVQVSRFCCFEILRQVDTVLWFGNWYRQASGGFSRLVLLLFTSLKQA